MQKLNKCFQCGNLPNPCDWGSCIEHRGRLEQTCSIWCSNADCYVDLSFTVDADKNVSGNEVMEILINTWNKLNP